MPKEQKFLPALIAMACLQSLPTEVVWVIFAHLSLHDKPSLRLVSTCVEQ